jgi:hypothetical protein
MSRLPEESQNVLFVFSQDGPYDEQNGSQTDSGHYWVYDGKVYHRFLWNAEGIRFIRSQAYLPKYVVGNCLFLSAWERQELEWETARVGIKIPIFDSEEECSDTNLLIQHDQLIYDQGVPAGFFYIGKGMERSKENGEESD